MADIILLYSKIMSAMTNRLQSKQVDIANEQWKLWKVLQKMVSEKLYSWRIQQKIDIVCEHVGRQTPRLTTSLQGDTELFRRTIYILFLENITCDVEGRFGDLQKKMMIITCLLNPTLQDLDEDVYDVLRKFSSILPKSNDLSPHFWGWRHGLETLGEKTQKSVWLARPLWAFTETFTWVSMTLLVALPPKRKIPFLPRE